MWIVYELLIICLYTYNLVVNSTQSGQVTAIYIYIYIYNPTAGYRIACSVATLSYDNCYANLRDYSNSLLCGLLERYGKYPHVL
jgi:hypothetical protein